MKISRSITNIFNVFSTAKRIKADDVKRAKSVRFAVTSIVYSLLMVVFAFGGAYLLTLQDIGTWALLYIFIIALAVVLLGGAVIECIGALLRVIVQFTINRRPMSWIALIIFLASIGVSVFIIIHFLG